MTEKLTRRRMLSLLGATAGLHALPGASQARSDIPWDLIVVGGGNAGLPAAIFAAQRGARVLIVDAAPRLGGTLWLSSGQMSAAGTRLQAARGIEDSAQSHYDDVMRISRGTADPDIVRLAVFNAAETFDWLMDCGFEPRPEHPVRGTNHEPYSHPRYAWSKDGGRAILRVLEAQLQPHRDAGRVSVLTETEVTALLQSPDGTVTGVATRTRGGTTEHHGARNTLLTCGGYASNAELFEELEGARDYADASYPFSQGAGIGLCRAVGGYVRGGEHHLPLFGGVMASDNYPAPLVASARPWPPARPPWEIYVNVHGKRFLREDIASHDAHERALLEQPEERCWAVFDAAAFARAPQFVTGSFAGPLSEDDVRLAFDTGMPMFYRAPSLEALATAAGIDAAGLADTVADYNRGQASGRDSLGREHLPLPIAEPPFYAVQLQSWLLATFAGVAVDEQLRVRHRAGGVIPNLYAAGELLGAGQLQGQSYCGGMLVTPALTFGRLLGQKLLTFA